MNLWGKNTPKFGVVEDEKKTNNGKKRVFKRGKLYWDFNKQKLIYSNIY